MAFMIALGFGLLFVVLMDDLYERYLNHVDEINKERMITVEEKDMKKDYIVMNDGTVVEFNEEDQE